jgi:hypothetical protein
MTNAPKFVPKAVQGGSPLTPELKEFIDHAIIPALVRQYLVEIDSASTPEKHIGASTGERRVGGR